MPSSHGTNDPSTSLDLTAHRGAQLVQAAEALYQRVLVTWAGDVLELRRRNGLVPMWSSGGVHPESQATPPVVPMKKAA